MATIYRVEHVDTGQGPYMSSSKEFQRKYDMNAAHSVCQNHLPSWQDNLNTTKWRRYRHGFNSIEQLMRWFDGWEEALDESGYVIRRYDVTEGRHQSSELQTIFDYDYSTERF